MGDNPTGHRFSAVAESRAARHYDISARRHRIRPGFCPAESSLLAALEAFGPCGFESRPRHPS